MVLSKYESSIQQDLDKLDDKLKMLAGLSCIDIFGLDDNMLQRATALALAGIAPKPFDHAILAGYLSPQSDFGTEENEDSPFARRMPISNPGGGMAMLNQNCARRTTGHISGSMVTSLLRSRCGDRILIGKPDRAVYGEPAAWPPIFWARSSRTGGAGVYSGSVRCLRWRRMAASISQRVPS